MDLSETDIYKEISASKRATDEISARLMAVVPLASGLSAVLLAQIRPQDHLVILLSLFAAAITLGLFRWELWNIGTCRWLLQYGASLEKKRLPAFYVAEPRAPQRIGKRHAEKFIYAVTIATWLAVPALLVDKYDRTFKWVYCPLLLLIALSTIISLFAELEPKKQSKQGECNKPTSPN